MFATHTLSWAELRESKLAYCAHLEDSINIKFKLAFTTMPKNWTFGIFITNTHTFTHEQRVKVSSRYIFSVPFSIRCCWTRKIYFNFSLTLSRCFPAEKKINSFFQASQAQNNFSRLFRIFCAFSSCYCCCHRTRAKKAPLIRVRRKKMKSFHSQKLF